jgi:hypothetical protein
MSDLENFAKQTVQKAGLGDRQVAEILAKLTSADSKVAVARKLVKDAARSLYAIPAEDFDQLAELLADPQTRRRAEWRIGAYPFLDPRTTWAGHGYCLVLDAIFAEDEPLAKCHVVAIPAQWNRSIWRSERDLGDDGYTYRHWVYAELPAVEISDRSEPVACLLVSENIYGTFHWGDREVSLYRGEINVRSSILGSEVIAELDTRIESTGVR